MKSTQSSSFYNHTSSLNNNHSKIYKSSLSKKSKSVIDIKRLHTKSNNDYPDKTGIISYVQLNMEKKNDLNHESSLKEQLYSQRRKIHMKKLIEKEKINTLMLKKKELSDFNRKKPLVFSSVSKRESSSRLNKVDVGIQNTSFSKIPIIDSKSDNLFSQDIGNKHEETEEDNKMEINYTKMHNHSLKKAIEDYFNKKNDSLLNDNHSKVDNNSYNDNLVIPYPIQEENVYNQIKSIKNLEAKSIMDKIQLRLNDNISHLRCNSLLLMKKMQDKGCQSNHFISEIKTDNTTLHNETKMMNNNQGLYKRNNTIENLFMYRSRRARKVGLRIPIKNPIPKVIMNNRDDIALNDNALYKYKNRSYKVDNTSFIQKKKKYYQSITTRDQELKNNLTLCWNPEKYMNKELQEILYPRKLIGNLSVIQ